MNSKVKNKLKSIMVFTIGISAFYLVVGLYAPNYNIEEYELGHKTLGEYHLANYPEVQGANKFFGLANVVIINVISSGLYLDSTALKNRMNDDMENHIEATNTKSEK